MSTRIGPADHARRCSTWAVLWASVAILACIYAPAYIAYYWIGLRP